MTTDFVDSITKELDNASLEEVESLFFSLGEYETNPVDIETFIDDPYYLGRLFEETGFREYWRDVLYDIYPSPVYSPYSLVLLRGCLAGNTKISLLNGEHKEISLIVNDFNKDSDLWTLSWNLQRKEFEPTKIINAFSTGIKDVYEITLDNGEKIKCTEDHRFVSRNNKWVSIKSGLKEGTSLMPYHWDERSTYHYFKNPNDLRKWISRYQLVSEWKTNREGLHCHHKNFNKLDDRPSNLCVIPEKVHMDYHAKYGGRRFKEWRERIGEEEYIKILTERGRQRSIMFHYDPKFEKQREIRKEKIRQSMLADGGKRASEMGKKAQQVLGSEHNRRVMIAYNKSEKGRNESRRRAAHMRELLANKSDEEKHLIRLKQGLGSIVKNHGYDSKKYKDRLAEIHELDPQYNHTVKSIRYIGKEKVYDLTVDRNENFTLSSGIIAHNSIGRGKSTAACIGLLYDIYKLLCMENPKQSLGQTPDTNLTCVLFNATLGLTEDVGWDKLNSMLTTSPYFTSQMSKARGKHILPKDIVFNLGSRIGHTLGKAVFSGLIDEANFGILNDQVYDNFTSILRRMQTRFKNSNNILNSMPGKLWVVSSERGSASMINQLIKKNINRSDVYIDGDKISNSAIWHVIPERYGDSKFQVFVGNDVKAPKILTNTHDDKILKKEEFDRVINVPKEHIEDFEADIVSALQDLAGISTISSYKLFKAREKINLSARENPNPITDKFVLGFSDDSEINDFISIHDYFYNITNKTPRTIHIDIGLTGDRLGIAACMLTGFANNEIQDKSSLIKTKEVIPLTKTEWAIGIENKEGEAIPLFKIRNFIYWLEKMEYPIHKISCDGYQSVDMLQELEKRGYKTEVISVDKTGTPYISMRDAVYRGFHSLVNNELLLFELLDLEVDTNTGKIDHTREGSKDVADAVAGSYYSMLDSSKYMKVFFETPLTTSEPKSELTRIRELAYGR